MTEYVTTGTVIPRADTIRQSATRSAMDLLRKYPGLKNDEIGEILEEEEGWELADGSVSVIAARARRRLGLSRKRVKGT